MEILVTDVIDPMATTENGSASNYHSYEGEKIDVYFAIDLYLTPVWYVIGIPGNILAYCVWTRRRMRLSSGCYLAALALDECIFLIMQVSMMDALRCFTRLRMFIVLIHLVLFRL